MAQKIVTLLTDDLDGGDADETVTFALDGKTYEIDLTTANAEKLRGLLENFVNAGRRQPRSGQVSTSARTRSTTTTAAKPASGVDTAVIREWAKAQGLSVNDRGRVPAGVVDAYKAAHA